MAAARFMVAFVSAILLGAPAWAQAVWAWLRWSPFVRLGTMQHLTDRADGVGEILRWCSG